MKNKVPAFIAFAALLSLLSFALPLKAQHGGLGGLGGHSFGGFHGTSAGHSTGHSIGHSLGHLFGHHSNGTGKGTSSAKAKDVSEGPPLAGAAMVHGKVVQLSNPSNPQVVFISGRPRFHRPPLIVAAPGGRFERFRSGQYSDFVFCGDLGGFPNWRSFGGHFDCFRQGFFFDPYFFAGFFPGAFVSEEAADPLGATEIYEESQAMIAESSGDSAKASNEPPPQRESAAPAPETLLQLVDGSMYGLKEYWLEGGRLFYVTSYGGRNSIPLENIDFEKTLRLNADQGMKFELHPKSATKVP